MINIGELLNPIASDDPCGTDLRLNNDDNSIYHQLRESRNQARVLERKQGSSEESSQFTQMNEHWNFILKQVPKVLKEQSKDLEISCWFLEALVRSRGFEGLTEALWFLNQLIINYWQDLHPRPEGEDLEDRVACIQGLNGYANEGALIAPIYMLPIVPESASDKISTWDYIQAKSVENLKNEAHKTERYKTGIKTLEELQKQIKSSDASFYQDLLTQIESAKQNLDLLSETLDACCQKQAPSLKNIKEALNQVQTTVTALTKFMFKQTETETETEVATEVTAQKKVRNSDALVSGGLNDYQHAMRQLKSLTEFMQKTQPLSLITLQLTRLLRWSKMPMDAVITEMFLDKNLAAHVAHGFGVGSAQFEQPQEEYENENSAEYEGRNNFETDNYAETEEEYAQN